MPTVTDVTARARAVSAGLAEGGAWLDPAAVAEAEAAVERSLARLELGADHTVVALVGATGSGKSSLFNALATMDIAQTGARRPLTSLPMACVWGEGGSQELLDWLEVPAERRVTRETVLDADRQALLHGLVLLDLPDHDSTEVIHRVAVDRLVNQVDLLVWVVDPQKYADDALHSGYLQRMTGHDEVMVVVLNQIDRLGPDEADTCRRDLRRLLDGDGLAKVRLLPVSAKRGDGVDDLRALLASVVQNRSAIEERLDADLLAASTALATGLAASEPTDPPGVDRLVNEFAGAAGVHTVLDALSAEYRRRGVARVNWPVLRWVRRLRPDALGRLGGRVGDADLRLIATSLMPMSAPSQRPRVELAVDALVSATGDALPRRWADAVHASAAAGGSNLVSTLDNSVASVDLELSPPAWWRMVWVLQYLLLLTAVVGAGWLLVGWVSGLFGDGLADPPAMLGLSLPLFLVILGLVGGALLGGVASALLSAEARRRRAGAQQRMYDVVRLVAEERVVAPVRAVLAKHRATRVALAGEVAAPPVVSEPAGTTPPSSGADVTSEVPRQSPSPVPEDSSVTV